MWKEHTQWLKQQNVQTIVDFSDHCTYQCYMTTDKEHACEVKEGIKTCYQKQAPMHGRERYNVINYCPITSWIGIVGHLNANGELKCNGMMREVRFNRRVHQDPPFNAEVTQLITQSSTIAASNASTKEGKLGGAWMIMSRIGDEVLSNRLCHKEWVDNSSIAAEALVLLELVKVIVKKVETSEKGK